jgi:hypothetical protein
VSKPKEIKPKVVPDDLQGIVQATLLAIPSAAATSLKKALPTSHQAFHKEALDVARALAHRGEIHRWMKGSTEIFSARDPFATLESVAVHRLAGKTLTKGQLKPLVAQEAPGHEALLDEWLPLAVKRGLLFDYPRKRFGAEPDVQSFLKPVFAALKKALETADIKGIPKQRIADAVLSEMGLPSRASAVDAAAPARLNGSQPQAQREEFLGALRQLTSENPTQAVHSVHDLRRRLTMNADQFDKVALELSREGVVSLHHHDHPNSLSELERSKLVRDARGTHYIAIAIRRS